MFIDIHVHVRRLPGPLRANGATYATPEEIVKRFDDLQIERAAVLPGVSPECCHVPQSNEEVLEMARTYDGRFIPFCNVDPRAVSNSADADLGRLLRFYKDQGCKGVGEIAANLPILDPLVQNLFKHIEAVGLPATFHLAPQIGNIYGLYDDPGLPQLERSLARFPHLKFFGHSQSFWAEMAPLEKPADRYGYPAYPVRKEGVVPRLMRQYPNLYGDLSANSGFNALKRDPEYAVRFIEEFQDRLMFGTDMTSVNSPAPLVDFLLELRDGEKITENTFNKMARDNAIRILGLEK